MNPLWAAVCIVSGNGITQRITDSSFLFAMIAMLNCTYIFK